MRRVVIKVTPILPNYQIEVEFQPSLLATFFGAKNQTFTYRGSGGVWHQFPSGIRTTDWMDEFLRDASAEYKIWNRKLAVAHGAR